MKNTAKSLSPEQQEQLNKKLFKAVTAGDFENVKTLCNQGADPNAVDSSGDTVLYFAVSSGNLEFVKYLIAQGAAPNAVINGHGTVLHVAAGTGRLALARCLVEGGADPNVVNGCKYTVLHYAIRYAIKTGNLDVVKYFIEHGADLNAVNAWKDTVLHCTADLEDLSLLKLLLAAGAFLPQKVAIPQGFSHADFDDLGRLLLSNPQQFSESANRDEALVDQWKVLLEGLPKDEGTRHNLIALVIYETYTTLFKKAIHEKLGIDPAISFEQNEVFKKAAVAQADILSPMPTPINPPENPQAEQTFVNRFRPEGPVPSLMTLSARSLAESAIDGQLQR
ncbi:MAG: uncharacterized protein K0R63_1167 [Rickettsiales bacterium]|jgi:hypothetical protein|nr:uncharacterized protein [Rickettsiales bacterium]